DSDYRVDVADFAGIARRNGRDARPEEGLLPVLDTRACIRVKGIDAVVLGGDQNDVVRAPLYQEVRDIERLGIDLAVHGAREKLAKCRRSHVGRSQYGFIRILTGPEVVVVMREHSGRRVRGGGARHGGIRTEISRRIRGAHLVAVARACAEPAVAEARADVRRNLTE